MLEQTVARAAPPDRVMHRLATFALSFRLLVALWLVYALALWSKGVV